MNLFSKISNIIPEEKETYNGRIFLTLDMDWACDAIIEDSITLIEEANLPATWFITHNTPIIDRIRRNPNFELGIHPNFNPLLQGNGNDQNVTLIIQSLMKIIPEAKTCRSHSLTSGTVIQNALSLTPITHEVNLYIPEQTGIMIPPFRLWDGIIRVPYSFCDYTRCIYNDIFHLDKFFKIGDGPFVFDFHPIHVFLNTCDISDYEKAKNYQNEPNLLKNCINSKKTGSRDILRALLSLRQI